MFEDDHDAILPGDAADDLVALLRTSPALAADRLRTLARGGDANAQLAYAQLLINGIGCDRDADAALHWFRAAAEAGNGMAMNMVGRCHEYGFGTPVDAALAATWYRQGASAGCDWAIYNLAQLLAHGRGVAQDRAAAFATFQRAAAMGHARSMYFLGQYHENGWETPRDPEQAALLYERAARLGDFRGQCAYASVLVERGDVPGALHWLQQGIGAATPAYRAQLASVLAASTHADLRDLARGMVDGASDATGVPGRAT